MIRRSLLAAAIVAAALASPAAGPNESWPQFRGASAGVAENDPALPDSWSATSNIAWTAGVPGMGWSSPVVWGDHVFLTSVVNTGETDYDALMFQLKKRFSNNYSAQVSYTLGKSRGNTSGNGAPLSNFQIGTDMHLELNEGPSDFDNRHNFTVSGTALVPRTGGLNLSWVARALSGRPFSFTNGNVDPDLNGPRHVRFTSY